MDMQFSIIENLAGKSPTTSPSHSTKTFSFDVTVAVLQAV